MWNNRRRGSGIRCEENWLVDERRFSGLRNRIYGIDNCNGSGSEISGPRTMESDLFCLSM